jgi:SAM-dependent methyltransferase
MALLVYKFSDYEHTAEREQYRSLCKQMKSYYATRNEICIFIANYNIYDCELDGIIIKQDAIICVEFKNYGGKVTVTDNGNWKLSDGTIIKGGSKKSVYQQAKLNHIAIRQGFSEGGIMPSKMLKNIAALVVFHQPIILDNHLSAKTQCWLHVADETSFMEKVQDITSKVTNLTQDDMLLLIDRLALSREYLDENYSNCEILDCSITDVNTNKSDASKGSSKENIVEVIPKDDKCNETNRHLVDYVSRVISALFKGETSKINVFELTDVKELFASKGIFLTHQQLITVELEKAKEKTNKLSRFLCREVKAINEHLVFWEEGEEVFNQPNVEQQAIVNNGPVQFRKSKTVLPHWLDKYLFVGMDAVYAPEHSRYEYNLDLDSEELKVYLGTYFPRSYAELFCIADNLFHHVEFKKTLQEKSHISILDFGCGTGGELIGLLTALTKFISKTLAIEISVCDGSELALEALKKIVSLCGENSRLCITLKTQKKVIVDTSDLSVDDYGSNFDFILCDKMACELLSHKVIKSEVYTKIAATLCPLLSDTGIFILLDVTTKDEHQKYFYPQLMNRELNQYISHNPDYATLLPLSCGYNENCTEFCFMQQTFVVSHSHKTNDESRVCYRIITTRKFKNELLHGISNGTCFVIHPYKYKQEDYSSLCVKGSLESTTIIDSFNLNY